jgi:hypothetical protein
VHWGPMYFVLFRFYTLLLPATTAVFESYTHTPLHWPLPAVRDLTRDGRWSTYDVSVLKLSNVSFRGKSARMGNTLKIPSLTKLARLGHFPPASQAGRLAGPVFYVYVFSLPIPVIDTYTLN